MTTRTLHVSAAVCMIAALTLFTFCLITATWDGRWVLAVLLVVGFCGFTEMAERR